MRQRTYEHPFFKWQHIYFLLTMAMIGLSMLTYVAGVLFVKSVTAAPPILIGLATAILYYHIAHFFTGIGNLVYFYTKVVSSVRQKRIFKTLFGLLVSPVSIIVCYIGILLLGLSSCAG